MSGEAERQDRDEETLPPPASTRWADDEGGEGDETRPLPPFFAGDAPPARPAPPVQRTGPEERAAPPEQTGAPPEPTDAEAAPNEAFPFEHGSVEAPAPVVEEEAGTVEDEDFPVEAFDVPGLGQEPEVPPADTGARAAEEAIADRLERLATRLREGGPGAVTAELDSGDRFDALLAGMIAGYLAARGD